ncbi:MAG: HAD-IA family hydrolase [Sphingomonadaceae bacterium]|nr:HAD-IA family hydrolase [Sphingomonadaceae bacterium]
MPLIDELDAVVFDVGEVLFGWSLRALYAKLIADPAKLDWFLANVVTTGWHFQHDAGRSTAETVAELVAEHPAHRDLIEAFPRRFSETITGPIPGMHELVAELDDRGVPLYAITNFGHEFWALFRPSQPIFDRFRDIVISGTERMMKPDPAIFELAKQRFGGNAARMLFVDDRADNVAAAEAAGFRGWQFDGDAARLRAALLG